MKSMKKTLSKNKLLGSLKRKTSGLHRSATNATSSANASQPAPTPGATPEETAHNNVRAFCESGGNVQGDEILFLPLIVEAAESSPSAAAECAHMIRKFLTKDYYSRPSWQYNALMLVRILSDNPGRSFTRSLDGTFADTAKKLLHDGKDSKVQRMLMEILDDFEHAKMDDENLKPLVELWKAEKAAAYQKFGGPNPPDQRRFQPVMTNAHSQNYFARSHHNKRLPDPVELASRLEEARTSAKLLEQVVMNTAPVEMLENDLIKEFADRCQSASRSIQGYMTAENPSPDNDTMESLIDTNEQLQTALNQHRRAVVQARKQLGMGGATPDGMTPTSNGNDRVLEWTQTQADITAMGAHDPLLNERLANNGKGKETEPLSKEDGPGEDPFADPKGDNDLEDHGGRFADEPFHPGFGVASGSNAARPGEGSGSRPVEENPNQLLKRTQRDDVSESDIYAASSRPGAK